LPEISRFDPQALAICLRPGDIVKFLRGSETAGTYNYYRVCVN
jgi:DNA-directed RNA polymerase subunit H (RpoH/RPB5)